MIKTAPIRRLLCLLLLAAFFTASSVILAVDAFLAPYSAITSRSRRDGASSRPLCMIFFRNTQPQSQQEERFSTASASTAAPSVAVVSSPGLPVDINSHRVNTMLQTHGWTLAAATMLGSALSTSHGGFNILLSPSLTAATADVSTEVLVLLTSMVTFLLIGLDYYMDVVSHRREATLVHLSRAHYVATLFGRRPTRQQESSLSLDTIQPVLATSTWLAIVAATCDHVLFRYLLLPYLSLHMPMALAVMMQAVLYGLLTTSWNYASISTDTTTHTQSSSLHDKEEQQLVMATQTIQACLLGSISAMSGFSAMLLPILAQALYQVHVWNASWHSCNDQLDWIDEQQSSALEQQASSTPAAVERFFYAFDTEHCHSLSLRNTRRAVTYAFLSDSTTTPSPQQVEQVFNELAADTNSNNNKQQRLHLDKFVPLLVTLRTTSSPSITMTTSAAAVPSSE